MFRSANAFNGLDGRRLVVRMIDHGLPLRLGDHRDEVRMIHTKSINDLESVHTGIAEFEEKIRAHHEAGGSGWKEEREMKSDLMAILPTELKREHNVLQSAVDPRKTYLDFSAEIRSQASRLFRNNRH